MGQEALKSFGHWQIYVIVISCQLGKGEEENNLNKSGFATFNIISPQGQGRVNIPIEVLYDLILL